MIVLVLFGVLIGTVINLSNENSKQNEVIEKLKEEKLKEEKPVLIANDNKEENKDK